MVAVSTPLTNDTEQKRRKQTLERAKANHLSKQLQMRLQYAKLKVEHGWQRQNLNEVENLYFHHSHLRGPRSASLSKPPLTTNTPASATTTSLAHIAVPTDLRVEGAPSYAKDENPFLRISQDPKETERPHGIFATDVSETPIEEDSPVTVAVSHVTLEIPNAERLTTLNAEPSETAFYELQSHSQFDMGSANHSHTLRRSSIPAAVETPSAQTSSQGDLFNSSLMSLATSHSPTPLFPSPTRSDSFEFTTDPSRPSPSREPAQSQPTARRALPASLSSTPSIPTFSTNSPLTYDSFWSSHSSSTTAYRTMLSTAGIMGGMINPALRSGSAAGGVPSPLVHRATFDAGKRGLARDGSTIQLVAGSEAQ